MVAEVDSSSPGRSLMVRYFRAALYGFAQWLGEAVIGIIPLFMYELVHRYSKRPITATCPDQNTAINQLYFGCSKIVESASQEICILAVVISGLAVLSISPIGNRERRRTVFTRLLLLLAVISLIVGSLFYAFYTAHLDHDADAITYYVLAVALISSLCLALEDAILLA